MGVISIRCRGYAIPLQSATQKWHRHLLITWEALVNQGLTCVRLGKDGDTYVWPKPKLELSITD